MFGKNIYPENVIENVRKTSRSSKKIKVQKKKSELICNFELSSSAIHIRIARRILHLPLELLKIPKNTSKIKISFFQRLSAIEV